MLGVRGDVRRPDLRPDLWDTLAIEDEAALRDRIPLQETSGIAPILSIGDELTACC
jgi:hypothetical protein